MEKFVDAEYPDYGYINKQITWDQPVYDHVTKEVTYDVPVYQEVTQSLPYEITVPESYDVTKSRDEQQQVTDYRLVWVPDPQQPQPQPFSPDSPNGPPGEYPPVAPGSPPGPLGGGYGPFSNGPGLGPWNPGSGPGLLAGYQPGGPDDPNSLPLVLNWDTSGGGFSPDDFWNNYDNNQGLAPWLIGGRDGSGRPAIFPGH